MMAAGGAFAQRAGTATPTGPEVDPVVEALLRRLIGRLCTGPPPREAPRGTRCRGAPGAESENGAQELVLDVCLAGRRYTLFCSLPAQPQVSVALSPRERQVVRLVAQGLTNNTIAAILEISRWTVATYVRRLFAKLDVRSRGEMVARVYEDHLMEAMHAGTLTGTGPAGARRPA
jgi:DNA-binding CsgD family transcriptional regulator